MEWTNGQVFEFLKLYRSEPAIWNPKHPLHKNKKNVYDSWTRISSSLNLPVKELKSKKNSLMATFRSHRRRIEASIKSGAGEEEIYRPIWFAYQKMEEFLAPVYDCGPTTSTLDADDELPLQLQNDTEPPGYDSQESSHGEEETQLDSSARPGLALDSSCHGGISVPSSHREKRSRLAYKIDDARKQIKQTFATLNNVLNKKETEGLALESSFHGGISVPSSHREKRRRLAYEIDDARKQMKQTFATLNNVLNKEETDDCDLYGQLLAKKLRTYSVHERHLIMYHIDGLLLQKLPRSAMPSPCNSYTSSPTPSPVNRYDPVSISDEKC